MIRAPLPEAQPLVLSLTRTGALHPSIGGCLRMGGAVMLRDALNVTEGFAMAVWLAGRKLERLGDLSAGARHVLSLMDGGCEWLDWALLQDRPARDWADDAEMLQAIQRELHGGETMLLPVARVTVAPRALLYLPAPTLETLVRAEAEGTDSPQLWAALRQSRFITAADVDTVLGWLDQLQARNTPLLKNLGLECLTRLYDTMNDPTLHALGIQDMDGLRLAAQWALGTSRTPQTFCDWMQFYGTFITTPVPRSESPVKLVQELGQWIQHVLPLTFDALGSMHTGSGTLLEHIRHGLRLGMAQGHRIGPCSLSSAALQLARFTPMLSFPRSQASEFVQQYLDELQRLCAETDTLRDMQCSQDGRYVYCTLGNRPNRNVRIQAEVDGRLHVVGLV